MAQNFYVIGGLYVDTKFDQLAPGNKEQRQGPYRSYDQALVVWRGLSWRYVDDCFRRYWIIEDKG